MADTIRFLTLTGDPEFASLLQWHHHITLVVGRLLFAHCLFTSLCHLFSKGLFAVLTNVTDAGRSVAPENECEELSYQIVVEPTFLDIHLTFGTGMEALFHTTFSYFAP